MINFLTICTIAGLFLFFTGVVHIAIWGYSFIKNFSFFLKLNRIKKKEGYHWIYCLYDIRHACLFESYNVYYKKYLINNTKERLGKLNVKPVSRGEYHDTH